MAHLLRGMAADGGIRVVAADTTDIVREAVQRHDASPTAGAALGRTLSAALLLSHVLLKDHRDRVTVRIDGGGPLGGAIADAGLDGVVRGYVGQATVDPPLREDGKLDVGLAVGRDGTIEVIRSQAPHGEPYGSSTDLISGEIAEDVAGYLARSEQIPSAVLLGVAYQNGQVSHAGGVVLQALPDADPAALELLEANVRAYGAFTDGLARHGLLQAMHELTWGMDMALLTEEALPLRFGCRCSDEGALQAIAHFTLEEREAMVQEDGGAETVCHWCGERRWFGPEAIASLRQEDVAEVRCPDCGTLWYRDVGVVRIRDGERCACGRPVALPS